MRVSPQRVSEIGERERAAFAAARPRSRQLAQQSAAHWLSGVPLHWMQDWPSPFPLFIREARGAVLTDVDEHRYLDFCLGDTGAMFGHSPEPVARAIAAQATRGLTAMLPGERVARVGERLAALFGLPFWQITQTATDANRALLRYARAITGRQRILVFNGSYHGSVDETLVRLAGSRSIPRPGLIGAAFAVHEHSSVVEFNDVPALQAALAAGDIACVLAEPVMTNAGMVLPDPGFHAELRALTRRCGTLLAIDETHTLSSGLGGYTRGQGLAPDFFICGKAIAGGLPCAVFGFTAEVEARIRALLDARGGGHSGMGTTLAANLLSLAALEATLAEVMSAASYAAMEARAIELEHGLRELILRRQLPWQVSRVGARCEFGFTATPPRNGSESLAAMQPELEALLHLYLLNRGVLLTPFHNMMLCSPVTPGGAVGRLLSALEAAVQELQA
ncbi:MAG: transaminase [Steroidobacteraceae bacterium]